MNPIKLFIVDDYQMLIDGFSALLAGESEVEVIGTAQNGLELQKLLSNKQPDVILLDVSMPVMNGKEAARWLKEKFPEVKILILTMHQELSNIKTLLKIGVDGYLLKGSGKDELMEAIFKVASGESYQDKRVIDILINDIIPSDQPNPDLFELTPREMEIVCLISKGLKSQEIAEKLFISPQTVLSHRKNILSKAKGNLQIRNMAALISYLSDQGLLNCG